MNKPSSQVSLSKEELRRTARGDAERTRSLNTHAHSADRQCSVRGEGGFSNTVLCQRQSKQSQGLKNWLSKGGKERAALQGRIERRVCRTGSFFFTPFYLCMDLIFPSSSLPITGLLLQECVPVTQRPCRGRMTSATGREPQSFRAQWSRSILRSLMLSRARPVCTALQ